MTVRLGMRGLLGALLLVGLGLGGATAPVQEAGEGPRREEIRDILDFPPAGSPHAAR